MIKITIKNNKAVLSCPEPTQDLELNTKNRNAAIKADYIKYGPLNLEDKEYWKGLVDHWNTTKRWQKKAFVGTVLHLTSHQEC